MKRTILLTIVLMAMILPLRAAYEYGAASFDISWVESSKQWVCKLTPHDPPTKLEQNIGNQGFVNIEGDKHAACSIVLNGSAGYSKEISFLYIKLFHKYALDQNFLDLMNSIGNSKSQMPITIKLKNGKKLEGTASVISFGGKVAEENGIRIDAGVICAAVQFSDMHCKGEPDPESLDHETFIAQILANNNIESLEIGKVKKKLYPDFSTSKTIQAMLKKLAECTDELNIYFPTK